MAAPTDTAAVPGALEPTVAAPTPATTGRFGRLRTIGGIWLPAFLVGVVLFLCFLWPLIGPVPPPTGGTILNSNLPSFSSGHPFGTDATGNDEWSRLLYGGRAWLEVSLGVSSIGLVIGGLLGVFAGVVGGWREALMMRL